MQEAEQERLLGDDEVVNVGQVAGAATASEQQVATALADSDGLVDGCGSTSVSV